LQQYVSANQIFETAHIEQTAFAAGIILGVCVTRKSQEIEGGKEEQVVVEGAMTRILLVDDHNLIREQLSQLIQKREQWKCAESSGLTGPRCAVL